MQNLIFFFNLSYLLCCLYIFQLTYLFFFQSFLLLSFLIFCHLSINWLAPSYVRSLARSYFASSSLFLLFLIYWLSYFSLIHWFLLLFFSLSFFDICPRSRHLPPRRSDPKFAHDLWFRHRSLTFLFSFPHRLILSSYCLNVINSPRL